MQHQSFPHAVNPEPKDLFSQCNEYAKSAVFNASIFLNVGLFTWLRIEFSHFHYQCFPAATADAAATALLFFSSFPSEAAVHLEPGSKTET